MKIDLSPKRRRPSFGHRGRILRGIKRGLLGLGAVTLLVGTPVFFHYDDYPFAAAELPEAVRAYRATGLPWTAKDVSPPISPQEDAAPFLRQAIASWPDASIVGRYDDRLFEATRDGKAAALLPAYAKAVAFGRAAARFPKRSFDLEEEAVDALLPFHKVGTLIRVLTLQAEDASVHAEDRRSLTDLEDARRLAGLIASEPTLSALSFGNRCEREVLKTAQACLIRASDKPTLLKRYRRWLAIPQPQHDLRLALRGEIYKRIAVARNEDLWLGKGFFSSSNVQEAYFDDHDPPASSLRREGVPEGLRCRAYMTRCLQMWTELANRTHGMRDPLTAVSNCANGIADHAYEQTQLSHLMDGVLFAQYSDLDLTNRTMDANRAVSLAFADALILHARTGHWPEATGALDPLGTGPLHVRFDGARFRVWSVGRNGKDDGGRYNRETIGDRSSDDIVAAFPPVPPIPFGPRPSRPIPAD